MNYKCTLLLHYVSIVFHWIYLFFFFAKSLCDILSMKITTQTNFIYLLTYWASFLYSSVVAFSNETSFKFCFSSRLDLIHVQKTVPLFDYLISYQHNVWQITLAWPCKYSRLCGKHDCVELAQMDECHVLKKAKRLPCPWAGRAFGLCTLCSICMGCCLCYGYAVHWVSYKLVNIIS